MARGGRLYSSEELASWVLEESLSDARSYLRMELHVLYHDSDKIGTFS
jgi:hypothetical protein